MAAGLQDIDTGLQDMAAGLQDMAAGLQVWLQDYGIARYG
jgi:hypothetical protein